MVKVLYGSKCNAWLGGELFLEGVKEFKNDKEGIDFAARYYLKFETVEVKAKASKKKVIVSE